MVSPPTQFLSQSQPQWSFTDLEETGDNNLDHEGGIDVDDFNLGHGTREFHFDDFNAWTVNGLPSASAPLFGEQSSPHAPDNQENPLTVGTPGNTFDFDFNEASHFGSGTPGNTLQTGPSVDDGLGIQMPLLGSGWKDGDAMELAEYPQGYPHFQDNLFAEGGEDVNDFATTPFMDPALDPTLETQLVSPSGGYLGSVESNENTSSDPVDGRSTWSTQRSGSETPAPQSGSSKWEFRENARTGKQWPTTYLDCDESGNYDPGREGRRRKHEEPKEKKRRLAPQQVKDYGLDENGQAKRPRLFSLLTARQKGDTEVVSLKLSSERGKKLLSRLPDNWPVGRLNVLSDEHIAKTWCAEDEEQGDGLSERKPKLRPRNRYIRYTSEDSDAPSVIGDPKGEEDDLRGHPAARGCINCRLGGHKCSLRETGNTWPCMQCIDAFEGEQIVRCELIVPPTKKQECEICLNGGIECSYNEEESDHSLPCEHCHDRGLKCIAGPDTDALSKRATYTPPPGVEYVPYRQFVACTGCRQVKKSCSLKNKTDKPPCRACEKAGIPCTFEKIVTTNPGKTRVQVEDDVAPVPSPNMPENPKQPSPKRELTEAQKKKRAGSARKSEAHLLTVPSGQSPGAPRSGKGVVTIINPHSTLTTEFQEYVPKPEEKPSAPVERFFMTDSEGHSGHTDTVLTSLSHPIRFAHDEPAECRWCIDPLYGVVGLNWRKPTVIVWADGLGYTELYDGHREHGVEAGIMCLSCTMMRVDILTCDPHTMVPLHPLFLDRKREEEAEAMVERLYQGRTLPGDKWCSVCPSAAMNECCAVREDGNVHGCGLRLCDPCAQHFAKVDGDLERLLRERLAGEKEVMECRADASFLLEDGLLMRNVMAGI